MVPYPNIKLETVCGEEREEVKEEEDEDRRAHFIVPTNTFQHSVNSSAGKTQNKSQS